MPPPPAPAPGDLTWTVLHDCHSLAGVHDEVGTREPQQLDETRLGALDAVRIDAAFETRRRLRAETEAVHRAGHARLLERCDLECDHGGAVGDLAVQTAHHARHTTDGLVGGVADEEVVGRQRPLDAVECDDALAVGGETDAETAAAAARRWSRARGPAARRGC